MRIDQITRKYDVQHQWRMFPLHPDTPLQGRSLEDLFKGSTVNVANMLDHLKATADQLGLAFGKRTMTYNSRRAQELGLWVETTAATTAGMFHMAIYKAYFKDGLNIAEIGTLLDIVDQCGLPVETAENILTERSYSDAVDQDWSLAKQNRIRAVPTLLINNLALTGFQAYEQLETLMKQAGISERKDL